MAPFVSPARSGLLLDLTAPFAPISSALKGLLSALRFFAAK